MDDLDSSIITRWIRRRGDYIGHYAHSSVAGVPPVWIEFAEIISGLAGWTLTTVALKLYDSLDFRLLREAKGEARALLLGHLRGYQERVVRTAGARPIWTPEDSKKGKSP